MIRFQHDFFSALIVALLSISNWSVADSDNCDLNRQFTFSWQFQDDCAMRPRGGTTQGTEVTLDKKSRDRWLAIQEEGISDFERDRRAILAMEGPYRVSFDFIEVAGYTENYAPPQPYQSWATEYVYLLEDSGDFISLQHIIVMFFVDDGEVSGPVVQKHWRQDWSYQKPKVLAYKGKQSWEQEAVPKSKISGSWSQSVFQVDDSPRYESWGHWEHNANFSSWESAKTWRPVPRRESSVRDDYHALEGYNRHTILANGWLHEETNFKLVLDKDGKPAASPYVAKELGVNRYDLIRGHDFTGGDEYFENTAKFWADVRDIWGAITRSNTRVQMTKGEGAPMFIRLFELAQKAENEGEGYNQAESRKVIQEIINDYLI